MASKDDDVRVPRKVWNATIAALIGAAYWCILQGYQWAVKVDRHFEATDRNVWEIQKTQGKECRP